VDKAAGRSWADIAITNQHGDVVLVAQHLLKILPYGGDS
jgi:hypothetical protein